MAVSDKERIDQLRETFRRFAIDACGDEAPTWRRVSMLAAGEPRVLAMAAEAQPGVQEPNLLLAALHYLLIDAPTPVAELLGAMSDEGIVAFLLGHEEQIRALVRDRLVQTNEVGRCAYLLPGLVAVSRTTDKPVSLVEVGASAGLLLAFDRYRYEYRDEQGETVHVGPASPVALRCAVRGERHPPLDLAALRVAGRVGIDLHPVRVDDADAVRWLRALVWPDDPARLALLDTALRALAADPPAVVAGDAFEVLPGIVRAVGPDVTPVVFHSMTLLHQSTEDRERFAGMVAALAADRDGGLVWLSSEFHRGRPELRLARFAGAEVTTTTLARHHPHGAWLEWLA